MLKKIISAAEAAELVPDGASVMFGGFMNCGAALAVVEALVAAGRRGLTMIGNDAGFPGDGLGKLLDNKMVSRLLVTHVGLNPEAGRQMMEGEIEYELIPIGTMAERIRAAGAGLGGVLTPTGLGTVAAEGKSVVNVDGRDYLLEKPLRADFALLKAHKADRAGNLVYRRAARNFNAVMATAAETVIVEAEHIVDIGRIDPDEVMSPGIFVDYLVQSPAAGCNWRKEPAVAS